MVMYELIASVGLLRITDIYMHVGYTCTYVYTYMCVCVCVCILVCLGVCACVCVCMHTCMHQGCTNVKLRWLPTRPDRHFQ